MQKKIVYVLVLMSFCVLGITGLQLYWNYKNYQAIVANFKKDANNALDIAVDKEKINRQNEMALKFRKWLADTSLINIECNINNRDSNTVFMVRDVHPRFLEDTSRKEKFYDFGINSFKQKLKKITPEAKALFINHFTEKIFKEHIKTGTIWYYTQTLGDSITKAFDESKLNISNLTSLYEKELQKKEIYSSFLFNSNHKPSEGHFITVKINTGLRTIDKGMVWAILESPNSYYLREMRWLILSSFLLIGITVFCFYYTIKTLFNQHKLVAIKNQFISNMTHEIHTPLSSIQITAEALKKFDLDEESKNKYLDIILYQTKKLNNLSEEILANAKLESPNFLMNEEIDLNELISALIKETSLAHDISLKYIAPKEKVNIRGNNVHLSRSIVNLLENAIKYNSTSNPIIEIKISKNEKEVKLTIEDNGPGIPNEFKEKIFDQFYRIPTGNVHDIKGYGLGLSYVKKVILQHEGTISVMDNFPSGSIFSIKLPSNG